jgi:predicted GNAT superfamily acetyltransferase
LKESGTPPVADLEIRPLESEADFRACVRLQEEIWGEGFSERVPLAILGVSARLGGVASGAFDARGGMVAFVFGLTGIEMGRAVHWSDMLAVKPGYRDAGLGRALKLHQRELLLERGVRRMYWTFDPLESRNGRLNLSRLGGLGREYAEDMYGGSDSPLHAGIGTDRLVVTWEMESSRVVDRLSGFHRPPLLDELRDVPDAFPVSMEGEFPVPGEVRPPDPGEFGEGAILMAVPRDIQGLKARSMELAIAWRTATRAVLGPLLGSGDWEVSELLPGESVSRYLVTLREDPPAREETRRRSRSPFQPEDE